MVTGLVLALALTGQVDTSTAAAYQAAAIEWRRRAKDERSAHQTTRLALDVCRARVTEAQAERDLASAEGVSRGSRLALAIGAGLAGAGASVAGVGVALDNPQRQPVVIVGLSALVVGVITGAVALIADP